MTKLQVSFAEYRLFCGALLQKRPVILRRLERESEREHAEERKREYTKKRESEMTKERVRESEKERKRAREREKERESARARQRGREGERERERENSCKGVMAYVQMSHGTYKRVMAHM